MGYIEQLEKTNWDDVVESHIQAHQGVIEYVEQRYVVAPNPTPYQLVALYNQASNDGYLQSSVSELLRTGDLNYLLYPTNGFCCTSLVASLLWGLRAQESIGWKNPSFIVTTGVTPICTIPHASLGIDKEPSPDWETKNKKVIIHFTQSSNGKTKKIYTDEVGDLRSAPSLTRDATVPQIIPLGRLGTFRYRYQNATRTLICNTALSLEENLKKPHQ